MCSNDPPSHLSPLEPHHQPVVTDRQMLGSMVGRRSEQACVRSAMTVDHVCASLCKPGTFIHASHAGFVGMLLHTLGLEKALAESEGTSRNYGRIELGKPG